MTYKIDEENYRPLKEYNDIKKKMKLVNIPGATGILLLGCLLVKFTLIGGILYLMSCELVSEKILKIEDKLQRRKVYKDTGYLIPKDLKIESLNDDLKKYKRASSDHEEMEKIQEESLEIEQLSEEKIDFNDNIEVFELTDLKKDLIRLKLELSTLKQSNNEEGKVYKKNKRNQG